MPVRVFDPRAEEDIATAARPARLPSLRGCTIGLLDNGKIRVRELLDYMEEILRTDYGVTQVVRLRKPDASRPAPPEVLASMQQCQAVISAVGD